MLSPIWAPAARRVSPNAAAELGRRAGSIFNPSSNAEQIGSGTPFARRSGIGPAITRRTNAMGFSPCRNGNGGSPLSSVKTVAARL